MFTGQDASRLGAAGEFLLTLGIMYGLGKAASMDAPKPLTGPTRALTDAIGPTPQRIRDAQQRALVHGNTPWSAWLPIRLKPAR
jgi:hypothetical protein